MWGSTFAKKEWKAGLMGQQEPPSTLAWTPQVTTEMWLIKSLVVSGMAVR